MAAQTRTLRCARALADEVRSAARLANTPRGINFLSVAMQFRGSCSRRNYERLFMGGTFFRDEGFEERIVRLSNRSGGTMGKRAWRQRVRSQGRLD